MISYWRQKAAPIIAEVLASTRECTIQQQRQALRDAYPFGERRYHPYKIWLDEIARQTGRKTGKLRPISRGDETDPRQDEMFL